MSKEQEVRPPDNSVGSGESASGAFWVKAMRESGAYPELFDESRGTEMIDEMTEAVDEARAWAGREAEEVGEDGYSAATLTQLANLLESAAARIASLEAERDGAVAQVAEFAALMESMNTHELTMWGPDGGFAQLKRKIGEGNPVDSLASVKAGAWDEGSDAGYLDGQYSMGAETRPETVNPYRMEVNR